MSGHFDAEETRDPQAREEALFRALPAFLKLATAHAPGWARQLQGHDVTVVKSRAALARLPILRKSDLRERQIADPPFGGFATGGPGSWRRVFMSPGPIFEPMGEGPDPARAARALFAAGFRAGDLVHNAFAYHLTPGGFMLDAGARALGCTVLAAGTGNSEQQVEAIARLKPQGFTGTPDFLKVLLDKAREMKASASSIHKALVSGGALFPSLRRDYAERGVRVLQCYATAELGIVAYESEAMQGMIVEESVIVEIVRPGTSEVLPDGEVGEVVVTTFDPVYPMIRLATGDLSAVVPGRSPCGRTNMRIRGWMGRADQTTKVKGMFVHPQQVVDVGRRHPGLGRLRLVVTRAGDQDVMTLKAESAERSDSHAALIAVTLEMVCKLKGRVELVPLGSLPNDGKTIADERPGVV